MTVLPIAVPCQMGRAGLNTLLWPKNLIRSWFLCHKNCAGKCEDAISTSCAHLEQELSEERSQHQSRIKDYNRLEQRYDNLKVELLSYFTLAFNSISGLGT